MVHSIELVNARVKPDFVENRDACLPGRDIQFAPGGDA